MSINSKTLTNANSILRLRCKGIYDDWVIIRGFQADNRTTADNRTLAQTEDGVDGITSGGYVYESQNFNVHIMPNSPSLDVFRNIIRHFDGNMETAVIEFEQVQTALGRQANFSGFMTSGTGLSGGGKLFVGEQYNFRVTPVVEDNI